MNEKQNELGKFLQKSRAQKDLSLRSVEESTGVSNAYLSQIEHGRVQQPSPVILHKLSEIYGVPYNQVLRLAGYPVPGVVHPVGRVSTGKLFSRFENVTPEEENALSEYLEFLRTRRGSKLK